MKVYFIIPAAFVSLMACQTQDVKKKDLSGLAKDSTKFTNIQ